MFTHTKHFPFLPPYAEKKPNSENYSFQNWVFSSIFSGNDWVLGLENHHVYVNGFVTRKKGSKKK